MSLNRIVSVLVIGAVAFVAMAARADDQDDIDYRQHIMNTLDEQMAAIQQIVQHRAPVDNLSIHLQIVAVTAATAKDAFTAKVPGGRAKPAVWANWTDFSKRLDELVASTAALARSAKDTGVEATAAKLGTLNCKGCHDIYLEEKK